MRSTGKVLIWNSTSDNCSGFSTIQSLLMCGLTYRDNHKSALLNVMWGSSIWSYSWCFSCRNISWLPNSTIVELVVGTPVERRNFVKVPCTLPCRFSFWISAWHTCSRQQSTKLAKKWAKTLQKQCFFSNCPTHQMENSWFGANLEFSDSVLVFVRWIIWHRRRDIIGILCHKFYHFSHTLLHLQWVL